MLPRVIFILAPQACACLSVGPNRAACGATSGKLEGWFLVVRSVHPVCPENEIRVTPIGIVDTSGGFAGLVLQLSKSLVTGIPRLIGSSREKEYPSLTVRACDGLSWDTLARFELSKAVPTDMWQMGIC